MNKIDAIWQSALEEEKARFASLPVDELFSLPPLASGTIQRDDMAIDYAIQHDVRSGGAKADLVEDVHLLRVQIDYAFGIDESQKEVHLFVLKASRQLFLGFWRTYLAGFSLDEEGAVVLIPDGILAEFD